MSYSFLSLQSLTGPHLVMKPITEQDLEDAGAHAFEEMKVNRVEFFVHPTNEKSNSAMKRIGAPFEGILRNYRYLSETDLGTLASALNE